MQESEATFTEDVEIRGHIIDSLILPKVLDIITSGGGTFRIKISRSARLAVTPAMRWSA